MNMRRRKWENYNGKEINVRNKVGKRKGVKEKVRSEQRVSLWRVTEGE